jgi:hypothetical protein
MKKSRELEPVYDDVPDHLKHPIWTWIEPWFNTGNHGGVARVRQLANHMRWSFQSIGQYAQYGGPEANMREFIRRSCLADSETMLTVVEFLLDGDAGRSAGEALERILVVGNSAYAVSDDGESLTMRLDPTVRAQIEDVVRDADEGPAHWLAEAYNDAYGRTPRPGTSYEASLKAVEGALRGIVVPKDPKASLTKVINALRDGRANFEFELDDARGDAAGANEPEIDPLDTLLAMLRSLAYGQKTRHGDSGEVTVNSPEEAKAAFHLAVTLVQIGTTGALRRKT